jgi:hypothetical protein
MAVIPETGRCFPRRLVIDEDDLKGGWYPHRRAGRPGNDGYRKIDRRWG